MASFLWWVLPFLSWPFFKLSDMRRKCPAVRGGAFVEPWDRPEPVVSELASFKPTVHAEARTVGNSHRILATATSTPLPSCHFQQRSFWFKWLGFYQEREEWDFFSSRFSQYTRARKDKLETIRRAHERLACQAFGACPPKPNGQTEASR